MKRFAIALLLGILFASASMSTAFADYGHSGYSGYSGYRSGYHAPSHYGHSAYGGGHAQYRYVKVYRPVVYVAPHCDHYGR